MATWILTHGDADGVCSGAIALAANPEAHVYFTHPSGLLEDLDVVELGDEVIICDIALPDDVDGLLKRLTALAKEGHVTYIDHHPLPPSLDPSKIPGEFVHNVEVCASELTYVHFRESIPRDMERVAIYGAIGDYADDTPYIQRLLQDWDRRVLYFETGILLQALDAIGRNYERKRGIVWLLSENAPPSSDEELVKLALKQSRRDEELRLRVRREVKVMGDVAYVLDLGGSAGKAAVYARASAGTLVGLAGETREEKGVIDMSLRALEGVDLNIILRELAPKFGGSGGGHPVAAGARIPREKFMDFLRALSEAIKRQTAAETLT